MDEFSIIKAVTSLADGEINDPVLREEITAKIKDDKGLSFQYEVQLIVSNTLRKTLLKHPLTYSFRKKLKKLIDSAKDGGSL